MLKAHKDLVIILRHSKVQWPTVAIKVQDLMTKIYEEVIELHI